MSKNNTVDQQIALFGQTGSGKTALLCSFYGTEWDSTVNDQQIYSLQAKDDRHNLLMKMYLGMKEDSKVPPLNKFDSNRTVFALRQKNLPLKAAGKSDQVRITWHDYPGEWFEGGVSGEDERRQRIDTFRNLLESDVALFLVDGQKLHDYAGEEERYLTYLFSSFIESLNQVQEDILQDGKPLDQFPRVWVIGLSKADLWPDMTVRQFENLLNKKAGNEINALRMKLLEFIDKDDEFSFGKDFLLLSSAKFTPEHIDISQRKGIDVLLPLACVLPVERHLRWQKIKMIPLWAMKKLDQAGAVKIAAPFLLKVASPLKFGKGAKAVAAAAFTMIVERVVDLPTEVLEEQSKNALEKSGFLTALVAVFTKTLNQAEQDQILVREQR